jgi:hypothetical protein
MTKTYWSLRYPDAILPMVLDAFITERYIQVRRLALGSGLLPKSFPTDGALPLTPSLLA